MPSTHILSEVVTKHNLILETIRVISEYETSPDEEFYQYESEVISKIMNDMINGKKNERWKLIPFGRLKRIWEQYSKFKFIRDEKGMDMVRNICLFNIIRLYVNSILVGHAPEQPQTYLEDAGYCFLEKREPVKRVKPEDPNQLNLFSGDNEVSPKPEPEVEEDPYDNCNTRLDYTWDEFEDRLDDYIGHDTYSDYAVKPLLELWYELIRADSHEEQLLICDRILNVVHMRGDIAALFVQGGSNALSELSGEHVEPDIYRPM